LPEATLEHSSRRSFRRTTKRAAAPHPISLPASGEREEGRRKKEEGRGKREEGRGKAEGGRRKEEGRKEEGRKEGGRRKGYAPR